MVVAIRCRRAVVAAGDYVRLRSLRFAPTHIHRPYSRPFRAVAKSLHANSRPFRADAKSSHAYSRRLRVGCKAALRFAPQNTIANDSLLITNYYIYPLFDKTTSRRPGKA
jgi:hypothetical protein